MCTHTAPFHLLKNVTNKHSVNHIGSSHEPPNTVSTTVFSLDMLFSDMVKDKYLRYPNKRLNNVIQNRDDVIKEQMFGQVFKHGWLSGSERHW